MSESIRPAILITGLGDHINAVLLDFENGRLRAFALTADDLRSFPVPTDALAAYPVEWIEDEGVWEFELLGPPVEAVHYKWADNKNLVRDKSARRLSIQKRDGEPRQEVPVSALSQFDFSGISHDQVNQIVKDLGRDIVVVAGDQDYVILLPKSGESFDDLSKNIELDLAAKRHKAEEEAAEAEDTRREQQAASEKQKLKNFAKRSSDTSIFVNPFNFVSLPQTVSRDKPSGHSQRDADRHSGRIEVTWIAKAPLLFGDGTTQGLELDPDGGFRVAGSSLKGALRSLHETITGSCMRIFDTEAVPVYRQPAAVQQNRQLAVISGVDALGRPSTVRICGPASWTKIEQLHACREPKILRTGDLVTTEGAQTTTVHGREQFLPTTKFSFAGILEPSHIDAAVGKWVVLLSDAGARHPAHPYYAALGKISARDTPVDKSVAELWEREVDGAEDLRKRRGSGSRRDWAEVKFNRQVIGRRREVPEMPEVGDVLWVDVQGGKIKRMAASNLWRISGSGTTGERTPQDVHPCGSREVTQDHLCISCRCFGSAGDDSRERVGASKQLSYRGHVRVSELRVDCHHHDLVDRKLPPRGQPRIGSGQFTLKITDRRAETDNNQLPSSAWGSRAETNPLRGLRGRKFYWHGHTEESEGDWHRDTFRNHQSQNMTSQVKLIPRGTQLRATIWFENLSDLEMGSLIASLDPIRLLRPERDLLQWRHKDEATERSERLWTHLGGGKGLGFGSVEIEDARIYLEHPDRYRGVSPTLLTSQQIDALVGVFREETHANLAETWNELAAMLDPDRVDPQRIAYPPNAPWDSLRGGPSHEAFDKSYKYFGLTKGGGRGENSEEIIPLPSPSSDDPWLKILGDGR